MVALPVVLTAIGAVIGVRVEEIGQVSVELAMKAATELARAIEQRTGVTTAIDEPLWSACTTPDTCVAVNAPHEGEVVALRIFGGVTQLRLEARRGSGRELIEAHLARDPPWFTELQAIAAKLFPEPAREVTVSSSTPAPQIERARSWLPWIAIGTGAVAAGIGAGFGLSSRSARAAIETEPHSQAELDALQSRLYDHGLAANILFTTALVSCAAGVVLYFLE